MANRIMGITVEIGGDTTKLQTALKGVNGQIKSTQQLLVWEQHLLRLQQTSKVLCLRFRQRWVSRRTPCPLLMDRVSIPATIEPPDRSLRATIPAAQSHYSGGGNHHSGN